MAFEVMTNTVATYHDTMKPVQRTETKQNTETNHADHTANISVTETPAVVKMSGSEQGNTDESGMKRREGLPCDQQIKTAISEAKNKLKGKRTGCEFTYHEESNRVSIKVFDKDTKEVIREIPPEESIEMIEKIWELAGILVDEKR